MSLRVLVIEDDLDSLELMTYLFRAFGHDVVGASAGEAALRLAAEKPPDLVLCDLRLPGMDGFELLRKLKSLPALGPVPVIAVTADAMPGDRERVMNAGFDGYVPKPIDPQSFVREAEELSSRS